MTPKWLSLPFSQLTDVLFFPRTTSIMGLNSGTVLTFINQPESRSRPRRHLINFASLIYALFKLWIKFHARGERNQTIKAVFPPELSGGSQNGK